MNVIFAGCSRAPFHSAEAQQAAKIARIGYVDAGSPATTGHRAKAFVQGLRDLGYIEVAVL